MDPMEKKRKDLEGLLTELKAYEDEVKGGKAPEAAKAQEMDKKAEEAGALQDELEQYEARVKGLESIRRRGSFALPPDNQPGVDPVQDAKSGLDPVAGYMTLGDYVIAQGGVKRWIAEGKPKTNFTLAQVPTLMREKGRDKIFVPLRKAELGKLMETKAVPTIGEDVIEPTRLGDLVRVDEHDKLVLRDVLNISQTGSNAVEWVRLTNYTRAADPTAHGAQKPESDLTLDTETSPVRTVAVWMPVQDQQLDDLPQLQNLINTELTYDLEKRFEELVCWGTGTGQEFLGFFNDPDIWTCGQMDLAGTTRVVAADTLIDIIRRGITDVRVAGYEPNAILVHPYDWEDIVLLKATDNQYIWTVVTENNVSRLWGVPVVETVACEDFQGNATEERQILVGDFTRGATVWDRMQTTISTGWINDQFIRNMRTILGEWRAAFGVRRPGAFRDYQTQAPVSS